MALRFSSKNASVAQAGTAFAHGLGAVPDEWAMNLRAAPAGANLYLSAVDSTNITVANASGAVNADVFAVVNHSIVK